MSIFKRIWQLVITTSLLKQLWIAITLMMLVFFGANIIVNLISSKNYLNKQLEMKNIDNAVSLAVSISQMKKDPVSIELMLTAEFDNGHYHYIQLLDPNGQQLFARDSANENSHVPHWFTDLIRLNAPPGIAHIQNGWSQYGTLKLESSTNFAYEDLWHGALVSLAWSAAIALLSGLVGTLILKVIVRPLNDMVKLTEAISHKNFISIAEPKTLEFKRLAQAMNLLSARIKEMFRDQSKLLEQMRLEANYDPASGLMKRKYFISRLAAQVSNEDSFDEGLLINAHISNLAEINEKLGTLETDKFLKRMGQALNNVCELNSGLFAGRLTGADFSLFSNSASDQESLSTLISHVLTEASADISAQFANFKLAITVNLVSKADQFAGLKNLVTIINESNSADEIELLGMIYNSDSALYADKDEITWRSMLSLALDNKRLTLAKFPVLAADGAIIHHESPVRLQLEQDGAWVSAAEFISWAIQLDLITRIDDLVVEVALNDLAKGSQPIGLNVSTRAMCNPLYVEKLVSLLKKYSAVAQYLWLEVAEDGVFNHLEQFNAFCQALKPFASKIGVEHVGAQISRLGELHDLGLDYIKIDASVIRGIDSNTGNQAFLKGLCLIAHSIGLMTIAEGVTSPAEKAMLPTLGIDAMTGPGISL